MNKASILSLHNASLLDKREAFSEDDTKQSVSKSQLLWVKLLIKAQSFSLQLVILQGLITVQKSSLMKVFLINSIVIKHRAESRSSC